MAWRYFATRLNGDGTETMLATELELSNVSITRTLSGPDEITATITPEVARLQGEGGRPIFKTWSTALYAEKDGVIRGGGILTNMSADGPNLQLTATGFVSYIQGQPYLGNVAQWVEEDAMLPALYAWTYIRKVKGADTGLRASINSSPVRLGKKAVAEQKIYDGKDPNGKPTIIAAKPAEPYEWNWYTTTDLGQEFDNLAEETPFDYVEDHKWRSDDTIAHILTIRYPSIGRRRNDLRFVIGENILVVPTIEQDGDDFASEVFVLGAGEGSKMVKGGDSRPTDRLRRVAVVTDKTARRPERADAVASAELRMRDGDEDINQLVVMDHPNAHLGTFGLGDEILVQGSGEGWFADTYLWVRILSYSISPDDNDAITLEVARPERT